MFHHGSNAGYTHIPVDTLQRQCMSPYGSIHCTIYSPAFRAEISLNPVTYDSGMTEIYLWIMWSQPAYPRSVYLQVSLSFPCHRICLMTWSVSPSRNRTLQAWRRISCTVRISGWFRSILQLRFSSFLPACIPSSLSYIKRRTECILINFANCLKMRDTFQLHEWGPVSDISLYLRIWERIPLLQ